jgi:hypothetical protein
VKYPLLLIFPLLLFSFRHESDEVKPAQLLHQMYDSIKKVSTLRVTIQALERMENSYLTATAEIRLNIQPRKLYFVNRAKKLEILYNEQSSRKALVKPHVFPFISLWLDPSGNLMRRNQHYTIHELGFDFIAHSIAFTLNKDKNGIRSIKYLGKSIRNGTLCHLLEYENNNYGFTDYVTAENETASLISARLCVNDYLLRLKNNLLNEFGYLKKGMILKVPTLFCRKALVFLGEKHMLPVSVSLYDDAGLFEAYDYTDMIVNKPFVATEFQRQNKEYGF